MQKSNWITILRNSMDFGRAGVMIKKVLKRVSDPKGLLTYEQNMQWLKKYCQDFDKAAKDIAPDIWAESVDFGREMQARAACILPQVGYNLGGGGGYTILYFITRFRKPECIVETGVAAGYSSRAFLAALEKNGVGSLYSSDFPYFRLPEPDRFIGIMVEAELKKRWNLYTAGDEKNLPEILGKINEIDLFHYDSDKSYSGRQYALSKIEGRMSKDGIIMMDDIQNNSYFHDYVKSRNVAIWHIFSFEDKYIGLIGDIGKQS